MWWRMHPWACLAALWVRPVSNTLRGSLSLSILARIAPSPSLLAYHFFSVAFYSIWVMFVHPRSVTNPANPDKPLMVMPKIWEYPWLAAKSVAVVSRWSRARIALADEISFGRHASCLAHSCGRKYGGGDAAIQRRFLVMLVILAGLARY